MRTYKIKSTAVLAFALIYSLTLYAPIDASCEKKAQQRKGKTQASSVQTKNSPALRARSSTASKDPRAHTETLTSQTQAHPQVFASGASITECRELNMYSVREPYIEISEERSTGNYFDDQIKVRGALEGSCLIEAGYFEEGRKVKDIPIETTRDFKRFEFEIKAKGDKDPQLRVYNVFGDRDIYDIGSDGRYEDFLEEERDRYGADRSRESRDFFDGIFGRY